MTDIETPSGGAVRAATAADIDALVRIINRAYEVESFFVHGARIDADEVWAKLEGGRFLVLDEGGVVTGCVYLEISGERGYFGPLAIDPAHQGGGRARRLIAAVERLCRAAGARRLELTVVDLRTDLPAFYQRLGFIASGTSPFPEPDKLKLPCHFVIYAKDLGA